LGASNSVASAALVSKLVIVEHTAVLLDVIWSIDLAVIFVLFEDFLVIWLFKL
jgi:hypothetical protein